MKYTERAKLPTGRLPCGCYADTTFNPENYRIIFCPKHKASSDMYEALKDFSQYWTPEKILTTPPSLFSELRQALAEAEGK